MTDRPISLASGVLPEFNAVAVADAAVAAGFDAAGLWIEPEKWTPRHISDVRIALNGLPVLDVEVIWIKPGPGNPDHLRILDIGAELGAANALVVSSDPDPGATAAKFRELCEHAAAFGTRVALEFGLFTDVKNLDAALGILDRVNHPSAALLIDTLHLSRSGGTAKDVSRVPQRLLSYTQICDAGPNAPSRDDAAGIIAEAVDGRLLCGDGTLPLHEVLDRLPERQPLSVELRSKALRNAYPDARERAKALARSTREFLTS
jgi:sugar phosphate isomerase/epimerase